MKPRKWLRSYWPLFFPLLLYAPGIMGWIPYPSTGSEFTDLLISHVPNAIYLKEALLEYRQVPFWSPTILSGYPFAANPLSGLWYPPGWFALLFPLPEGFSILLAIHALGGGIGLYKFLRKAGINHPSAVFGGCAFMLMPKISAHYGAGHITLLYAVFWTPWLLLAARREQRFLWSAICLAGIFLADPRWAAFSGLLWISYVLAHSQYRAIEYVLKTGKTILISFLLAGPLVVPLMQYVALSTRRKMGVEDIFIHSLRGEEWIGLLFPSGGRTVETAMYAGGCVLVLGVSSLSEKEIRKKTWFWWSTTVVSGMIALGTNVPGVKFLAYIPGVNLIRVPSRALFILGFSLTIIASHALHAMMKSKWVAKKADYWVSGIGLFVIMLLGGVGYIGKNYPLNLIWGMGFLAIAVLIFHFRKFLYGKQWLYSLILSVLILDGLGAAWINIDYRPGPEKSSHPNNLQAIQGNEFGQFRIYSPSYSIPQHVAARNSLELVDGVDPLQLEKYVEFTERATGVPNPGYSVTLPPFKGDPATANQMYQPDPTLLGVLNVRYLISEFEMTAPEFEIIYSQNNFFQYRNLNEFPRAWVYPPSQRVSLEKILEGGVTWKNAVVKNWRPNKIEILAEGPGTLILSEIAYPGWEVKINGKKVTWFPVFDILRGVELTQGTHLVKFVYRPKTVYFGLLISFIGLGIVLKGTRSEK